ASSANGIWINLFVGSNTVIPLASGKVALSISTNYPWSGNIQLSVNPLKATRFAMHLRLPGWASGEAVPGHLYSFAQTDSVPQPQLLINGKTTAYTVADGYAVVERVWKKGDKIEWNLPMPVRTVVTRPEVKQNHDRVALQRGPLLYCVEGADNNGKAWNILFPAGTVAREAAMQVLDEPLIALKATVPVIQTSEDGFSLQTTKKEITAIPYYSWCNRGSNQMQVWLPVKINDVKVNY
ncbi:MAG TPA: hypothetical protein VL307_07775, partial [Chitinophagaceae bacterium]|nr:hypothetical protein [Chitinophagaceae bacterium]